MNRVLKQVATGVLVVTLAACAAPGPQPGEMEIRRGVIEQINSVQIDSNHHQGVGAVAGGLAGLGIGSLIGAGTGRDVAMVLGTLGGALIGNEVQKKHDRPVVGQQVIWSRSRSLRAPICGSGSGSTSKATATARGSSPSSSAGRSRRHCSARGECLQIREGCGARPSAAVRERLLRAGRPF